MTTTKAKSKTTLPTTQDSNNVILTEAEALKKFNDLKADIDEKKANVQKIEVTNAITYGNLLTTVTDLNKTIKKLEEKRKEVIKPAKDFIEKTKQIADKITGDCQTIIAEGKKKLTVYDEAEAEKERIRKAAEEKKRLADLEKIETENKRKKGILDSIANLVTDAEKAINEAIELESKEKILKELTNVKNKFYVDVKATPGDMTEFQDELNIALEAIMEMGKKATADARNGVYEKVVQNETIAEALEFAAEAQEEQVFEKQAAVATRSFGSGMSSHRSASYRTTWEFKVVEPDQVPDRFKTVDKALVDAWIKELKENKDEALQNGNVIYGLQLIEVKTPVLR